ncbi:MAG: proline--tRNA ligase [Methanobacteriota archaeon]|nr:MAG: proline--tRNA ligase [Euryarchaeota archaeon]
MPLENPKSDFSKWYSEILLRGNIVDVRTPIKGANVLLPNGYQIWEEIKRALDDEFQKTGHQDAYFPIFIPEDFLEKEAEHFEGFVPEVAWVTKVGNTELKKKIALRPTSETIMYYMYAQWINSHSDLPLKMNQFCNIIRMDTGETRPLLRDREFQWSEAHTCHATAEEAAEQVRESMRIYQTVFDELALSYMIFRRPPHDTFPGADYSIAYDTLLPDGRVLQIGTTHNLGQSFAKVFDIKFLDKDGETKIVHQTCYGMSTRVIAAVISLHGDDQGLILPPRFAPTQIVVVPIIFKKVDKEIIEAAKKLEEELKAQGYRVVADTRDNYTAGWKFAEWEMKGTPIRLEIGPKDLASNSVLMVRRDTGKKQKVTREELTEVLEKTMVDIHQSLKKKAEDYLQSMIRDVRTYDELKEMMETTRGIARGNWCGSEDCAKKIKDETKATVRGTREDLKEDPDGPCIYCGKEGKQMVYYAQQY